VIRWRPRKSARHPVMDMHFRSSAVEIKGPKEIDAMREVSKLAAETLSAVGEIVRPGLTTEEINSFVHAHTLRQGARPAPLNYKGFPKSVCTSINEVVCHGIPSSERVCGMAISSIST